MKFQIIANSFITLLFRLCNSTFSKYFHSLPNCDSQQVSLSIVWTRYVCNTHCAWSPERRIKHKWVKNKLLKTSVWMERCCIILVNAFLELKHRLSKRNRVLDNLSLPNRLATFSAPVKRGARSLSLQNSETEALGVLLNLVGSTMRINPANQLDEEHGDWQRCMQAIRVCKEVRFRLF